MQCTTGKTPAASQDITQPSPNHNTVLSGVTWNVKHNPNSNVTWSAY